MQFMPSKTLCSFSRIFPGQCHLELTDLVPLVRWECVAQSNQLVQYNIPPWAPFRPSYFLCALDQIFGRYPTCRRPLLANVVQVQKIPVRLRQLVVDLMQLRILPFTVSVAALGRRCSGAVSNSCSRVGRTASTITGLFRAMPRCSICKAIGFPLGVNSGCADIIKPHHLHINLTQTFCLLLRHVLRWCGAGFLLLQGWRLDRDESAGAVE